MTRPQTITEQELFSQPERWLALVNRFSRDNPLAGLTLTDFDEIVVFGSGSSYYLALLLGDLLETATGVRAQVLPSCDVFLQRARYLNPTRGKRRLGIGISRSGESSEAALAAEALKDQEVPLVVITCTEASSLLKYADYPFVIPEGHEDGLVMLRSFTSMVLGFQLALAAQQGQAIAAFESLENAGIRVLETYAEPLTRLAHARDFNRFVFLGSGLTYPLALESALKMQEMSIVTSEAYHGLEYRHGPKSTADEHTLVTLFARDADDTFDSDLLRDLKAYGVGTLVIGENLERFAPYSDLSADLGSGLTEEQRLVLELLPVHLVALQTALRLGRNPDAPRNLTQVVRLELV